MLTPKRAEGPHDFEIRMTREAISQDWSALASNNLTAEQRRALRDHLDMNISALRDLVHRTNRKTEPTGLIAASGRKFAGEVGG